MNRVARTTTYDITVEGDDAELHFVPAGGGNDFRSMPSECEA